MLSSTPSRRELLVWIGIAALVMVTAGSLRGSAGAGTTPSAQTRVAYLATGFNFADALGAGPAAGLGLGPILLVQGSILPQPTLDELNRLQPETVYIVGGTGVIPDTVKDTVEALSFNPAVIRLAGNNRYATAAALSAATFPTTGYYPRVAYAANDNVDDGTAGNPYTPLTALIEAPAPGYLVVDAAINFAVSNDAGLASCWLYLGDPSAVLTGSIMSFVFEELDYHKTCSTTGVVEVDAGEHTIGVRVLPLIGVEGLGGVLSVTWIPFGSHGQPASP